MNEDALIAAILADRNDPACYGVYGDWLEERGDPQGELIALQLRSYETGDQDAGLLQQAKLHLERHPALTPRLDRWRARFRWRWGFIDAVELDDPSPDDLRAVLEHRSCRLVRQLQLDLDGPSAPAVLDALVQTPPTIGRLNLRQAGGAVDRARDDFWERVPELEQLEIEGERVFDTLRHPRLATLIIEDGSPFPRDAVWELPALLTLFWNAPVTVEDVAALWSSELPMLRSVTFGGTAEPGFADERFFAAIRRLDELSLPQDAFSADPLAAVETVLEHAERFAHLKRFDVFWHEVHEPPARDVMRELRRALPNLQDFDG